MKASFIFERLVPNFIKTTYGEEFNRLIDRVFRIVYGTAYRTIKQKRDLGCDGIIETEKTVIACYAPEKPDKSKFENKLSEDYQKFEKNWASLGYNLRFMTNQLLLASQVNSLKRLCNNCHIWGNGELTEFIRLQPPAVRRRLFLEVFDIPEELIVYDIVEEIIHEASKLETFVDITLDYSLPQNLDKKVERNFRKLRDLILRHYRDIYPGYGYIYHKVFGSLDDTQINTLKIKVIGTYETIKLRHDNFDDAFLELVSELSKKYPNDDEYRIYAKMLVLYIFEQCLIGEEP